MRNYSKYSYVAGSPAGQVRIDDGASPFLDAMASLLPKEMDKAIERTAYWLSMTMKRELRAGSPGGQSLTPLSKVQDRALLRRLGRKIRQGKPYARLIKSIRYQHYRGQQYAKVGWNGKWAAKIGSFLQQGGTVPLEGSHRLALIRRRLPPRKATTTITVPPRPVMLPIFQAHKQDIKAKVEQQLKAVIEREASKAGRKMARTLAAGAAGYMLGKIS